MYCRLVDGKAIDIVENYVGRYHPALHSEFVECPENVQPGWIYDADEDTWSAPPEPEAEEEEESSG